MATQKSVQYAAFINFLLIFNLYRGSFSKSCSPPDVNITCECLSQSISCTNLYNPDIDITQVVLNLQSDHYATDNLKSIIFDIKGLQLWPNATFVNSSFINVTLGSSLHELSDDLFMNLNDSLKYLTLTNNNLDHVPSNALRTVANLEYLDLSFNSIISLSKINFLNLQNLKVLKLDHNQITLIIDAFDTLNNLEILDLSYNNLRDLTVDMFKRLLKLKELNLSTNFIVDLHPMIVKELSSLRRLDISNNIISSFQKMDIHSSSLEQLFASNCSIQGTMTSGTLNFVPNLIMLDLSFNNLKVVSSKALSTLHRLETLVLSWNQIESLSDQAFAPLYNLKHLDLANNSIAVVEKLAFQNLSSLISLNMSHNILQGFFCTYTTDLIVLEELNLQKNQIRVVHPGTLSQSPFLSTLKMDGNLFDCEATCPAVYFSQFLKNHTYLKSTILCQTPPELYGKEISNVSFNLTSCPSYTFSYNKPCPIDDDDDYNMDYDDDITKYVSLTTSVTTTSKVTLYASKELDDDSLLINNTKLSTEEINTAAVTDVTLISLGSTDLMSALNSTDGVSTLYSTNSASSNAMSTSYGTPSMSSSVSTDAVSESDTMFSTDSMAREDITKLISTLNSLSQSDSTLSEEQTPPSIFILNQKPFNFTYFNIVRTDETSSLIEWSVNRKESPIICNLTLTIESYNTNQTRHSFNCSDNSFLINNLMMGASYNFCLSSHHVMYGVNTVCHSTYYSAQDVNSPSRSMSSSTTSNLPFFILLGLLLLVICLVFVLAARKVFKKHARGNHYNIADKETQVQKRKHKNQRQQSVRYSYTRNEISETF